MRLTCHLDTSVKKKMPNMYREIHEEKRDYLPKTFGYKGDLNAKIISNNLRTYFPETSIVVVESTGSVNVTTNPNESNLSFNLHFYYL